MNKIQRVCVVYTGKNKIGGKSWRQSQRFVLFTNFQWILLRINNFLSFIDELLFLS